MITMGERYHFITGLTCKDSGTLSLLRAYENNRGLGISVPQGGTVTGRQLTVPFTGVNNGVGVFLPLDTVSFTCLCVWTHLHVTLNVTSPVQWLNSPVPSSPVRLHHAVFHGSVTPGGVWFIKGTLLTGIRAHIFINHSMSSKPLTPVGDRMILFGLRHYPCYSLRHRIQSVAVL